MGFVAARWRRPDTHGPPRRVGPGRAQLRRLGHLVPRRRRPLHRLHLRGRPGADVRRRRGRVLRRAVHDHRLPDGLPGPDPAVVGVAPCTASSRRPTSSGPGSARRRWRCSSRSPASSRRCRTSRCSWSASRPCSRRWGSPATAGRIIIAFAILAAYTYQSGLRAPALIAFVKDTLIYIVIIVAIILHPGQARRLGDDLRRGGRQVRRVAQPRRRHPAQRQQPAAVRHAGVRARRSRCSSTRTASPACWPAGTAT